MFPLPQLFMADLGITASQWIDVEGLHEALSKRISYCAGGDFVVDVHDICPVSFDECSDIAPDKVLSYDLETMGLNFRDPHQPVINIGCTFGRIGRNDLRSIVLVLGKTGSSANCEIRSYPTEAQLFSAFGKLIRDEDPVVITGYNTFAFDNQYIASRAYLIQDMRTSSWYEVRQRWERARLIIADFGPLQKRFEKLDNNDPTRKELIEKMCEALRIKKSYRAPEPDLETRIYSGYRKEETLKGAFAYFGKQADTSFNFCSRIISERCEIEVQTLSSAAMGDNKIKRFPRYGGYEIDLWLVLKNDPSVKLPNMKLDTVAQHFIGGNKLPMPYDQLFAYYRSENLIKRREIAEYCAVDCELVLKVIRKKLLFFELTEMARICRVPLPKLVKAGQQIKVFSQLIYEIIVKDCVLNVRHMPPPDGYVGATVLVPTPGLHLYVACLDFASLYPSIIIANNLCLRTYVFPHNHKMIKSLTSQGKVRIRHVDACGATHIFVKADTVRGLVPDMEVKLLAARKAVKKQMKKERKLSADGDPQHTFMANLYNARQLAIKVSANSIYGFFGVTKGYLPFYPVAACTTSIGRDCIMKAKASAEKFLNENGGVDISHDGVKYSITGKVIYGDTDSIMVKFFGLPATEKGIHAGFKVASAMADHITHVTFNRESTILKHDEWMEMEKLYLRYLIWETKKRYIGLYLERADGKLKRDMKGVEARRTDVSAMVVKLYEDLIATIMPYTRLPATMEEIQAGCMKKLSTFLGALCADEIHADDFAITKGLKGFDSYKSDSVAQLCVARKTLARIESGELICEKPKAGDRISYVYLEGKEKAYQRAESTEWYKSHCSGKKRLKLDKLKYLDGLERPMIKLLAYICEDDAQREFDKTRAELKRLKMGARKLSHYFGEMRDPTPAKRLKRKIKAKAPPKKKKMRTLDKWIKKNN